MEVLFSCVFLLFHLKDFPNHLAGYKGFPRRTSEIVRYRMGTQTLLTRDILLKIWSEEFICITFAAAIRRTSRLLMVSYLRK